jgi:hypothetical protein
VKDEGEVVMHARDPRGLWLIEEVRALSFAKIIAPIGSILGGRLARGNEYSYN